MGFFSSSSNNDYIVEVDTQRTGNFTPLDKVMHENRAVKLADDHFKNGKRARVRHGKSIIYVAS